MGTGSPSRCVIPRSSSRAPSPAATLRRILADEGAEWITLDSTTLFAHPPTTAMEHEAWQRKPRLPVHREALTDQPIVRIIGRDDPRETVDGWQPWLPVVAGWLADGRRPIVFVHTPDNVDALVLARVFHEQVRAIVPGTRSVAGADRDRPADAVLTSTGPCVRISGRRCPPR